MARKTTPEPTQTPPKAKKDEKKPKKEKAQKTEPKPTKEQSDNDNTDTNRPRFSKRAILEDWLNKNYLFRFNIINSRVEFARGRSVKDAKFKFIEDFDINSIVRKADMDNLSFVSAPMLEATIKSDFVERYHPIRTYFQNLKGTPNGHIEQLANCVLTEKQNVWNTIFKNWLVASVANAFNDFGCQNQNCIVLIGGMGTYKSTFINQYISPQSLMPHYFSSTELNIEKPERIGITLAEKFIIHLDDTLSSLNKKDSEKMKNIITQHEISLIRPYGKNLEDLPRLGNFIASLNHKEFLTENQNRRYLPFEVLRIDTDQAKTIDRDLVWLEAYNLYKLGYKYHLSTDELNTLFDRFDGYQVTSTEGELFEKYYKGFKPFEKRINGSMYLKISEIQQHLQAMSKMPLNQRKLSNYLKMKEVEYKSQASREKAHCYTVYQYTANDILENEEKIRNQVDEDSKKQQQLF